MITKTIVEKCRIPIILAFLFIWTNAFAQSNVFSFSTSKFGALYTSGNGIPMQSKNSTIEVNLTNGGALCIIGEGRYKLAEFKNLSWFVNSSGALQIKGSDGSYFLVDKKKSLINVGTSECVMTFSVPASKSSFQNSYDRLFSYLQKNRRIKSGTSSSTSSTSSRHGSSATNTNGHKAVDLGLSVKWASCNIGTTVPHGLGSFFKWGSNYVSAQWGGTWRLPTQKEFKELESKCSWRWASQNGQNGYKVTGPNGNSIFLPAGGMYFYSTTGLESLGKFGIYWSSTTDGSSAWALSFGPNFINPSFCTSKDIGAKIRPVIN